MSGDILIVDSITSNRIVLKVKLSSAFYSVLQAASAQEALAICATEMPDLVLVTSELTDMGFGAFNNQLHAIPGCQKTPIVVVTNEDDAQCRMRRFREGAADVINSPISDTVLLARLRTLMRNAYRDTDQWIKPDAAKALGFAETRTTFLRPGRVAAVTPCAHPARDAKSARLSWHRFCNELTATTTHQLDRYDMRSGRGLKDMQINPDAVLLEIGSARDEHGLAPLAELRTASRTRDAKIIALMDNAKAPLAATALDMGAHDVIDYVTHMSEVDWRLNLQINRKMENDRLLAGVRTGLQVAVTDPLTGLYNRRFGMSQLDRIATETLQNKGEMALILADLDHFKLVNDRHGHAAGDAVLCQVSQIMSGVLRKEDIVARIGGEEFMILLPNVTPAQASRTARHICQSVRNTSISIGSLSGPASQSIFVTMSLGAALLSGADGHYLTPDALFRCADRALYGSKAGGRGTVTFSERSAA
ncbi:MAG: diguanylate cyclase [Pseudomonadota bacterium]